MLILGAAIGLAACSTGSSEPLGTGIASYDNLRNANTACAARGGKVVPRPDADPAQLSDYSCIIPGSK